MSRVSVAAGMGCVVLSAALLAAQEPSEVRGEPADQEIQRLRSEVSKLTREVRGLHVRLERIEDFLRELVREQRRLPVAEPADAPLEPLRPAEPISQGLRPHEPQPPGGDAWRIQWRKQVPDEVDSWIRPSILPGDRYHWDTFPTPPYPLGP